MPNPSGTFNGEVSGLWLVPYSSETRRVDEAVVWIAGGTPSETSERSVEIFTIPTRRSRISQAGELHLADGTIEGIVMGGNGQTTNEWMKRLIDLIRNQHIYFAVRLVTPRTGTATTGNKVELNGLTRTPRIAGGRAWDVSVPYREV